ncbi:MAG: DUF502 domain-containing protein [Planctomycetota bacterium]
MKRLSNLFFKGLLAILPISISLYAIYWAGSSAEHFLGKAIQYVIPPEKYFPGAGVVMGLAIVLFLGVLLEFWIFRKLFTFTEVLMQRIPLVKIIYGSVRDLLSFFGESKKRGLQQVVIVRLDSGMRVLGFVTRTEFEDLPARLTAPGEVAVYIPLSYQIGGYTVFMPADRLEPVALSVEQAMRFAVTAGMSSEKSEEGTGALLQKEKPEPDTPPAPASKEGVSS